MNREKPVLEVVDVDVLPNGDETLNVELGAALFAPNIEPVVCDVVGVLVDPKIEALGCDVVGCDAPNGEVPIPVCGCCGLLNNEKLGCALAVEVVAAKGELTLKGEPNMLEVLVCPTPKGELASAGAGCPTFRFAL